MKDKIVKCTEQYRTPSWGIDSATRTITCANTTPNHFWHNSEGYSWQAKVNRLEESEGIILDAISSKESKQVGGEHYQGNGMQVFDVWDAFDLDRYEANAIKYLLRWRKKNGVEDLQKAIHYIEILITREQKHDGT